MFQIHVVLDGPKNWLEYVPPWITAVASLIAFSVAVFIARNQNRLQATLAAKQVEIQNEQIQLQKMQLEQQARQLTKDLYDRRFAVFKAVDRFTAYVLQNNGKIQLAGPGEYRRWRGVMERAQMLFGEDVNEYLRTVDQTARDFYVAVHKFDKDRTNMEAIANNERLLNELSVALPRERVPVFLPYLGLPHKG